MILDSLMYMGSRSEAYLWSVLCNMGQPTWALSPSEIAASANPPSFVQTWTALTRVPGPPESPSKVPNWLGLSRNVLDLDQTCKPLENHEMFLCKLHQQICPNL